MEAKGIMLVLCLIKGTVAVPETSERGARNMKYKPPRAAAIFFTAKGGGHHTLFGWHRTRWFRHARFSAPPPPKSFIELGK